MHFSEEGFHNFDQITSLIPSRAGLPRAQTLEAEV